MTMTMPIVDWDSTPDYNTPLFPSYEGDICFVSYDKSTIYESGAQDQEIILEKEMNDKHKICSQK